MGWWNISVIQIVTMTLISQEFLVSLFFIAQGKVCKSQDSATSIVKTSRSCEIMLPNFTSYFSSHTWWWIQGYILKFASGWIKKNQSILSPKVEIINWLIHLLKTHIQGCDCIFLFFRSGMYFSRCSLSFRLT